MPPVIVRNSCPSPGVPGGEIIPFGSGVYMVMLE
jgi:hypothetical protein